MGAGALGRLDREHPGALGLQHRRGLHRLGGTPAGRDRGGDDEPPAGQLVGQGPGERRGGARLRSWPVPAGWLRRVLGAGTAVTAPAAARMCAGVVPQQPPTRDTPASANRRK